MHLRQFLHLAIRRRHHNGYSSEAARIFVIQLKEKDDAMAKLKRILLPFDVRSKYNKLWYFEQLGNVIYPSLTIFSASSWIIFAAIFLAACRN